MKLRLLILIVLLGMSLVPGAMTSYAQEAARIRVLIVDGFSNHDWKQTTDVTRWILEKSGRFEVDVSTIPADSAGRSAWRTDFGGYAAIIQNTNNVWATNTRWPREMEIALERYVANGGGLYILHSANNAFPHWKEYDKMIGLGWRSKSTGYALEVDEKNDIVRYAPGEGENTGHGERFNALIQVLNRHPINSGFPDAWQTVNTEVYYFPRGVAENLTVLSYAYDSTSTRRMWPVEWVVNYGKGRIYNSSLGHLWKGEVYPEAYRCAGYQTTVIRAAEWLATGNVSYPVPADFPTRSKPRLRNESDFRQPRPPAINSPEIHTDNRITFRYFSRTASRVTLSGEFLKGHVPMKRDAAGIWSVTVDPVIPDIYPYSFRVDSVQIADPNNTYVFANERFKRSIVDVPGNTPLVHSMQDVPHGKVSYYYYKSGTLGTIRPLLVYTPPGYNPQGKEKYPVLYLIHGGSDTEETWTKVGRVNFIIDNLIAQGKAKPMIIVMPYGNVRPNLMADFTVDVINDIIPFVETNFSVITKSMGRAVAGFSVGGGQALNIGLTNTDKFAYVCSYAPYTGTEEFRKNFTNWTPNASALNRQLKLFTISVGTDDFLYESVKQNIAMFQQKKLNVEPIIVSGGHTWMNCRRFLATSLQQLFAK